MSLLPLLLGLWLTALLMQQLLVSGAAAAVGGTQQLPPPELTREETIFLTQGIHVQQYNLTQADARSSVTVSQRILLRNRQSYATLKSLFKRRSLFHSFLRSLAVATTELQRPPNG